MFKDTTAFSSFSVPDLAEAKQFYGGTLGLEIEERPEGLNLKLAGGASVFLYPSDTYTAPKHTVLNFSVENIDEAVDALNERGVRMEQYDLPTMKTDERGILRGEEGPRAIAWFRDPAGHILSVLQEA
jgi:catechol 2,3-dioxygenase-like lactoylglutathione lyase family enzyme